MAQLLDNLMALRGDDGCMGELAQTCGFDSIDAAQAGYSLAAPVVVTGLVDNGSTPGGVTNLVQSTRALLEGSEADDVAHRFGAIDDLVGEEVVQEIFGKRLGSVCAKLASDAGISENRAKSLIEATSLVGLAAIAQEAGGDLSHEAIAAVIDQERGSSVNQADVSEAADEKESVGPAVLAYDDENGSRSKGVLVGLGALAVVLLIAGAAFTLSGGDDAPAEETATEGSTSTTGEDETASTEPAGDETDGEGVDGEVVDVDADPAATDAEVVRLAVPMTDVAGAAPDAEGVLTFDFDTATGEICYEVTSTNIEGPYRSHIHAGGAGVKGGIVVDLGPLTSGNTGCVENLAVDTNAILADPAGHYAELHDVSEEFTIRGQLSEAMTDEVVRLAVPMTDVAGAAPDAEGVLTFDFDTATGEVCYEVTSTNIEGPYRSHIHAGGAGVKGGIVVDLGPLTSGNTGCVENLAVDTNAILADPAGHYAELHDVSEEFTIRGQLSEAMTDGDDPAQTGDDDTTVVDTDGDGAVIVLDGGRIFLEGEVPDVETLDELVASLDGMDSSALLVNNLRIVDDAPVPTGRVVIADAIFFDVNSDEVRNIDPETLDAIGALALSRSDWILTVVGHTDAQGSDVYNLELSLRRASAVRDLLAELGVDDDHLRIRGAGETTPISDNATAEGRAENRRIEFEFTPQS